MNTFSVIGLIAISVGFINNVVNGASIAEHSPENPHFNVLKPSNGKHHNIIEIMQGTLRGRERLNLEGNKYYSFQSIPFAKPPVDKLRFKPPVPHHRWNGILNATEDTPICYQQKHIGQEDCLYLSVYSKNVFELASRGLKPVMLYIFGGGFVEGHPREELYNMDYMTMGDVVIVILNYRLGALGFANIKESSGKYLTANVGMKDQVLGMKWVQRNIRHFGGDPNQVTIFGHSAGGGSVSLHLLSPLSKGLFHRAIAQSGSSLCPWAQGLPGFGEKLAEVLNISAPTPSVLLKNLQKVAVADLIDAQAIILNMKFNDQQYGHPILEGIGSGNFYTEAPQILLESGRFNKVPLLTGFVSLEGLYVHVGERREQFKYLYELDNLIPYRIKPDQRQTVANLIKHFYFNGKNPQQGVDFQDGLFNIISDTHFGVDLYQAAKLHSRFNDVYFYKFSADTVLNFFKRIDPVTAAIPGVSHVDELGYLFKGDYSPKIAIPSPEYTWIKQTVSLWTNFAINGSPNIAGETPWLRVGSTKDHFDYYDIGTSLSAQVDPFKSRIDFWIDIYSRYS